MAPRGGGGAPCSEGDGGTDRLTTTGSGRDWMVLSHKKVNLVQYLPQLVLSEGLSLPLGTYRVAADFLA